MVWIIDIIKGFLMGVSNIIPGFSGGTMAVMLKVYDRIIFDISDITKHPFKSIKDLMFIILGLLCGMVVAMFTIAFLLKKFPFPTIMFFVGLIIGSIPQMFKQSVEDNKSKLNYLFIIPGILLIVLISIISNGNAKLEISFKALTLVLIMGMISSGAMIMPGLSGSLTLMAFGYYGLILNSGTDFMKGIVNGNSVLDEFIVMCVFTVGCVLGLLIISKMMSYLLKKNRNAVYFFIFGLICASPFSIIWAACHNDDYNINYKSPFMWIFSFVFLVIGIVLPIACKKIEKKIKDNNEKNIEDSKNEELNDNEKNEGVLL